MFRTPLAVALLSAFSLLAGHEVAYRAVVWPGSPAHLLHATGHGWWGLAAPLAAGSLVLLMLLTLSSRTAGSYRLVPRSATVLFLAVELLERLLHGAVLDVGSFAVPVALGAAVTYVFAAAAASLLHAVEARLAAPPSAAPFRLPAPVRLFSLRRQPALLPFSVACTPPRGPPLSV